MKWGVPEQEAIQEELDRLNQQMSGNADVFYLAGGITNIRILPPHPEHPRGVWNRELHEHFFRIEGEKYFFTCLGETCPVCQKSRVLMKSKDAEAVKLGEDMKRSRRHLVNAVILSAPNEFEAGKVYALRLPVRAMKKCLALDRDEDDEAGWGDITGVWHDQQGQGLLGITLRITKSGQGLNTEYDVQPVLTNQQPRSDTLELIRSRGGDPDAVELHNLFQLQPPPDEDRLAHILAKVDVVTQPAAAPQPVGPAQTGRSGPVSVSSQARTPAPPPPPPSSNE